MAFPVKDIWENILREISKSLDWIIQSHSRSALSQFNYMIFWLVLIICDGIFLIIHTAWKVSVFGVILVRIQSECVKMPTKANFEPLTMKQSLTWYCSYNMLQIESEGHLEFCNEPGFPGSAQRIVGFFSFIFFFFLFFI